MGDLIRARLAARPFVPFRLVLTDRSAHDVPEPGAAVVDGDAVVRLSARVPGAPDGWALRALISLPHVVSVEDAGDTPVLVTSGG